MLTPPRIVAAVPHACAREEDLFAAVYAALPHPMTPQPSGWDGFNDCLRDYEDRLLIIVPGAAEWPRDRLALLVEVCAARRVAVRLRPLG